MSICVTCDREFNASRSDMKYCTSACSPRKLYVGQRDIRATIEKYEREIVDIMALVQLERKKIEELKWYRMQYNRVKDYVNHEVDPDVNFIKNNILTL